MFDIPSGNTSMGRHVNRKMGDMPVLFMERSVFLTERIIRSVAIHYRGLIGRWLLQNILVFQGAPSYCSMILRSCWPCRSLPSFVGIGVLIARLYDNFTIRNPIYGRQLIHCPDANLQGALITENNELCHQQSFPSSMLGIKHDYVRLALHFICSTAILKLHTAPKAIGFNRRCIEKNRESSAAWRIPAINGQYLTFLGAFLTLHILLHLTRVNITTSLLPMLFQTTSSRGRAAFVSNIVIVLVNLCGIIGSAFTTKQHGREVTLTVGFILMVFCQIAIPFVVEIHMGLGGATRMLTGYTTAMFMLTCVVSCGLSWSWGSLLWTVSDGKIHSAGQVVGMAFNFAVSFAQMQYYLLMLCRLKNGILAYYAMWIWS